MWMRRGVRLSSLAACLAVPALITVVSAGEAPALLTWTDVTDKEQARRLSPGFQAEPGFIQRHPSETSRIFELGHGTDGLPATFHNGHHGVKHGSVLKLPVCAFKGRLHTFRLQNSGLIPPELQEKYKEVMSYHAFEIGGDMSGEVTIGPEGLRAQIWVGAGEHVCYIDPHTVGRADKYTMYSYKDPRMDRSEPFPKIQPMEQRGPNARRLTMLNGSTLQSAGRRLADATKLIHTPPAGKQSYRTYRLCVAISPNYLEFASNQGTTAMAMLTATLTRANGIWRRVLSINLELCTKQGELLKTGAQGNNLPDGNPDAYIDSCTDAMSSMGVAESDYDMGHYMSASGGGGLGGCCVCLQGQKCAGGTALNNPKGDPFDVDYVAHEMGHQFNHGHTFSGAKGNCGSNFLANEAVEPGSGRTILSYAGICATDDTDKQSIPYFSAVSLGVYARGQHDDTYPPGDSAAQGIMKTCGTVTQTQNNRPTATTHSMCTIPRSTPFVLKGSGTDPDGSDTLTYTWEQMDSASKPTPLTAESKDGPLFISVAPSTTGHTRDFPALVTQMKNHGTTNVDPLERLPTMSRDLHFSMTVRDQHNSAGGGSSDTAIGTWHSSFTTVQVAKAGPLVVQAPGAATEVKTGAVSIEWRLLKHDKSTLLRSADYSVEYATCTSTESQCSDKKNWANQWGESCAVYAAQKYCTTAGAVGQGWNADWGSMDSTAPAPVAEKPTAACCACGGGSTRSVCVPSTFTALRGLDGSASWTLTSNGFGRATVMVPSSLAGKKVVFRVIAGASSTQMTSDAFCRFYATSAVFDVKAGPAGPISVTRTIPENAATDVKNTGLQVVFLLDRDAQRTQSAASVSVEVKGGGSVIKTIPGDSSDIMLEGATVRISIGDIASGSVAIEVKVPDGLIESLAQQTLSFTTSISAAASAQRSAPTVVSTDPANMATDVLQDASITFTLSTYAAPALGVVEVLDDKGNLICNVSAKDMTFKDSKLSFGLKDFGCFLYPAEKHTVKMARDSVVNPAGSLTLASEYTIEFTAWVDNAPPKVIETLPADGARNVSDDELISIFFDEDIYPVEPAGANITIVPRKAGKTTFSISPLDDEQAEYYWADDMSGELLIIPVELFQPRTTYDVTIPANSIEDWSRNRAAAHTFSFTTGDLHAPYCKTASWSHIAGSDPVVKILFQDWEGQDEPSKLARGASGNFWLTNLNMRTETISVPITNQNRVSVAGLEVTITFPVSSFTDGSSYTLRWPDHILKDDYNNPIFGWTHGYNNDCNNTTWTFSTSVTPPSPSPSSSPLPSPSPFPSSTPATVDASKTCAHSAALFLLGGIYNLVN
eukprot:TRINITY_DN17344_c0_g2_i1.p1 TRINITY_DN17344_c0_g2~~TRINITY_DN17344_c0_g2_i1.p1  ORF type:complete len:1333 (+),score=177.67 TRINITY_DN17344_c0_g2_i1:277-4275(+)